MASKEVEGCAPGNVIPSARSARATAAPWLNAAEAAACAPGTNVVPMHRASRAVTPESVLRLTGSRGCAVVEMSCPRARSERKPVTSGSRGGNKGTRARAAMRVMPWQRRVAKFRSSRRAAQRVMTEFYESARGESVEQVRMAGGGASRHQPYAHKWGGMMACKRN
jgi:hypothetical protein